MGFNNNFNSPSVATAQATPADLGWQRFLLDGATVDDPYSQHGSLSEDSTGTTWTSAGSGTFPNADSKKPNHGVIHSRQLFDGNGDALDWSEAFTFEMIIEKITDGATLKNTKCYFGGGLAGAANGLDDTNGSFGMVSQWDLGSASNYQKCRRFKYNYADNMSNCNQEWDNVFNIAHGPRHAAHGGLTRMYMYRYHPDDIPNSGDTGMGSTNFLGTSPKFPASGPVYVFATCGRTTTWTSPATAKFRLWYTVSGADNTWTPA